MNEEVKTNSQNIALNNLALPRYIKVKDSINDLLKILDREKVEVDGKDRFLNALLQLIEENDGKTVDEKYDDITDAVYNGNVFSNYFEEENKKLAVEILSQTSLLNEEEKFVYRVNFLMPDDQDFSRVYSECGKNPKRVLQAYNLNEADLKLVMGRIMEVAKFFRQYQAEKDRLIVLAASDAVKIATKNPTDENIAKAKEKINSLPDGELKTSLSDQIVEAEPVSVPVEPKLLDPQKLKEGFASLGQGNSFKIDEDQTPIVSEDTNTKDVSNMTFDDLLAETDESGLEPTPFEPVEIVIPTKEDDEIDLTSSEDTTDDVPEMPVEDTNAIEEVPESVEEKIVTVEESKPDMTKKAVASQENESVGQDVMSAIQSIVVAAKDNANRVETLEAELHKKDDEIKNLNDVTAEQEKHLIEKETKIALQEEKIKSYEQELTDKDIALEKANTTISERDAELSKKDDEIADKDEQIASVTATLNAYKNAYTEIQKLVASAQSQVLASVDNNQKKI